MRRIDQLRLVNASCEGWRKVIVEHDHDSAVSGNGIFEIQQRCALQPSLQYCTGKDGLLNKMGGLLLSSLRMPAFNGHNASTKSCIIQPYYISHSNSACMTSVQSLYYCAGEHGLLNDMGGL